MSFPPSLLQFYLVWTMAIMFLSDEGLCRYSVKNNRFGLTMFPSVYPQKASPLTPRLKEFFFFFFENQELWNDLEEYYLTICK